MPKPLFVIKDFWQGITYDETENTLDGFSDVVNIDLKNINGGAVLGENFVQTSWGGAFLWSNNPVNWNIDIHTIAEWGSSNVFAPRSPTLAVTGQIYSYNGNTKTWSVFKNKVLTTEPPIFHEIATFNGSLVYSAWVGSIGSCYGWTSGSNQQIGVTNGSANVTLLTWFWQQLFSKRMVWGTLYLWNGSAYVAYTVLSFTDSTHITLTTNYTGSTTQTKGYLYNFTDSWFLNELWTVTACSLPNGTTLYRPMIEKDWQLYVWDGDRICTLNSTMTNWQTTIGSGAISLGADWTAKQIQKIWGYLYILADNMNEAYYNSQTLGQAPLQNQSRLYIWDGSSQGFANIIECGSHCYCIRAIENRIYALIKSNKWDGALFTYFNGADFPTIGKIQLWNITCPLSNLAYDRGKFFIVANGKDKETVTQNTLHVFGSYAVEKMCMYKSYQNSSGAINGVCYIKDESDGSDVASTNGGLWPILMINQDLASGDKMLRRSAAWFLASGYLVTQKYEMTYNQFWQLMKGVQLNFKEVLPSWCTAEVWYRGDESTTFVKLWTLTSLNQNNVLYGIYNRYKKIQLQIWLKSATGNTTPKLIKIIAY